MTPLTQCEGCARHVRVIEARCPFCGRARGAETVPAPMTETPRGLSRALLTTLGVTLSLVACQGRGQASQPHPIVAAPYGAPPPPQDAGSVASQAVWHVTLPSPIRMAARAQTPLEISVTNPGSSALDPGRGRMSFRVNGEPSPALDLAFHNGTFEPHWESLPPRATVRDQRNVLEAVMPTPGEYLVELLIGGRPVDARRVTVVP